MRWAFTATFLAISIAPANAGAWNTFLRQIGAGHSDGYHAATGCCRTCPPAHQGYFISGGPVATSSPFATSYPVRSQGSAVHDQDRVYYHDGAAPVDVPLPQSPAPATPTPPARPPVDFQPQPDPQARQLPPPAPHMVQTITRLPFSGEAPSSAPPTGPAAAPRLEAQFRRAIGVNAPTAP